MNKDVIPLPEFPGDHRIVQPNIKSPNLLPFASNAIKTTKYNMYSTSFNP